MESQLDYMASDMNFGFTGNYANALIWVTFTLTTACSTGALLMIWFHGGEGGCTQGTGHSLATPAG